MSQRILVLGALSEIAEATCRLYAAEGAELLLVGRDRARLDAVKADLEIRGASRVEVEAGNLITLDPEESLERWSAMLGKFDVILVAYGVLGDQRRLERDLGAAAALIDTNYRSAALWSLAGANKLEAAKHGTLLVIGSVAGDRGRQSNYLYGSTKAGLAVLVEGLAHRLARSGARAILVKPGFVGTAMTAHIPNKGALWSSPEKIASLIKAAALSDKPVRYAPGYWRLIMMIIKSVPVAVFHRTKL